MKSIEMDSLFKFHFLSFSAPSAEVYQYMRVDKIPEGEFYAGAVRKRRYLCMLCTYKAFFKSNMVDHIRSQHFKITKSTHRNPQNYV
jgi:hypothetical protein